MYIPKHFVLDDVDRAHELIESNSFGTLITILDGAPFATHLPFVLDRAPAPNGTLRGHIARANPQWQSFGSGEALAIFAGPHAYVSPSWYEGDAPAVPTWNYAVVHAYGKPAIVEDPAGTRTFLQRLTQRAERRFPEPWTPDVLSDEYLSHMISQIVAFEMPIARLEAKAKLSQNRPAADRVRVADQLANDDDSPARAVSALMHDLVLDR